MPGRIALLGAGGSRRMRGGDKLLEPVGGVPLLRLLAARGMATGWPVTVTVPPGAEARQEALAELAVEVLVVPDSGEGMAASFRAVGRAVTGPVLIALGDMPEIETADLRALISSHSERPDAVIRATTADGTPGQPVLFPGRLVARFGDLSGDTGARSLLAGETPVPVPLPGRRAITDLDTPEAWAAWRGRTG